MSLFDLVINIIESSIMYYFIYKYFDFKQIEKLWLFILIDFTSITLCNSFINESSALLIIVTSVLIVCLKMFGEKIRIESIIVCFLSLIIDIVCNVVSLIIGYSNACYNCFIKDIVFNSCICFFKEKSIL